MKVNIFGFMSLVLVVAIAKQAPAATVTNLANYDFTGTVTAGVYSEAGQPDATFVGGNLAGGTLTTNNGSEGLVLNWADTSLGGNLDLRFAVPAYDGFVSEFVTTLGDHTPASAVGTFWDIHDSSYNGAHLTIYNDAYGVANALHTGWGGQAVGNTAAEVVTPGLHHIALVYSRGTTGSVNTGIFAEMYVDGVVIASLDRPDYQYPVGPLPTIGLLHLEGVGRALIGETDGLALSVFTGTFSPSDFVIPEPATLTLLGLGGLMFARRRRHA